jgi:hypothetical protein
VEVIRHHTIAFEYPTAFHAGFKQTSLEGLMRPITDKQILAVVATVDDVIDRIFLLNS